MTDKLLKMKRSERAQLKIDELKEKLEKVVAAHSAIHDTTRVQRMMKFNLRDLEKELRDAKKQEALDLRISAADEAAKQLREKEERKRQEKLQQDRQEMMRRVAG